MDTETTLDEETQRQVDELNRHLERGDELASLAEQKLKEGVYEDAYFLGYSALDQYLGCSKETFERKREELEKSVFSRVRAILHLEESIYSYSPTAAKIKKYMANQASFRAK